MIDMYRSPKKDLTASKINTLFYSIFSLSLSLSPFLSVGTAILYETRVEYLEFYWHNNFQDSTYRKKRLADGAQRRGSTLSARRLHNRMQFRRGRNRQHRVLRSVNHGAARGSSRRSLRGLPVRTRKMEGRSAYLNYNIPTGGT